MDCVNDKLNRHESQIKSAFNIDFKVGDKVCTVFGPGEIVRYSEKDKYVCTVDSWTKDCSVQPVLFCKSEDLGRLPEIKMDTCCPFQGVKMLSGSVLCTSCNKYH